MRPDYCPIGNEPCQSLCDTPCKVTKRTPISEFVAADAFMSEPFTDDVFAAYQQGIRFAERAHEIVEPARGNDAATGQIKSHPAPADGITPEGGGK